MVILSNQFDDDGTARLGKLKRSSMHHVLSSQGSMEQLPADGGRAPRTRLKPTGSLRGSRSGLHVSSLEMSPVDSTGVREPRLRGQEHSVESRISMGSGEASRSRPHRQRGEEMRRRYMRKHVSSDGADLSIVQSISKRVTRLPLRKRNDIYFPQEMDKQLMPIQDIRRQHNFRASKKMNASRDLLQLRPSNLQFFHKSLHEFAPVEKQMLHLDVQNLSAEPAQHTASKELFVPHGASHSPEGVNLTGS